MNCLTSFSQLKMSGDEKSLGARLCISHVSHIMHTL